MTFWEKLLEFDPELFMPGGANEGMEVNVQNMQLMPFGSGRHACPSMGYAVQVMPAFLATLVQCFDWAVSHQEGWELPQLNMKSRASSPPGFSPSCSSPHHASILSPCLAP
jgi:cytochrome P450